MNTMETQAMQNIACMTFIFHAGSSQVCSFEGPSGFLYQPSHALNAGSPPGFRFQGSRDVSLHGSSYVGFATTSVCTFCVYWIEQALNSALFDEDPVLNAPTANVQCFCGFAFQASYGSDAGSQGSCDFPCQGSSYVFSATTCVCSLCVDWTEEALHTALLEDDPLLDAPTVHVIPLGADGTVISTNPAAVKCCSSSSK